MVFIWVFGTLLRQRGVAGDGSKRGDNPTVSAWMEHNSSADPTQIVYCAHDGPIRAYLSG